MKRFVSRLREVSWETYGNLAGGLEDHELGRHLRLSVFRSCLDPYPSYDPKMDSSVQYQRAVRPQASGMACTLCTETSSSEWACPNNGVSFGSVPSRLTCRLLLSMHGCKGVSGLQASHRQEYQGPDVQAEYIRDLSLDVRFGETGHGDEPYSLPSCPTYKKRDTWITRISPTLSLTHCSKPTMMFTSTMYPIIALLAISLGPLVAAQNRARGEACTLDTQCHSNLCGGSQTCIGKQASEGSECDAAFVAEDCGLPG